MVYIFISDSVFDHNVAYQGSSLLLADYAPIINIINSNFTNHDATSYGLFHLKQKDIVMIEILESKFENIDSGVSIISTDNNVYLSLNIIESIFIIHVMLI